jgi:hypothetical protein
MLWSRLSAASVTGSSTPGADVLPGAVAPDVSMSPATMDRGGRGIIPGHEISPAKAERASTNVRTTVAQKRRRFFIIFSQKSCVNQKVVEL